MKIFIHTFFITIIVLFAVEIYLVWYKDFGKKSYYSYKNSFLSPFVFLFIPKTLPNFIKFTKAWLIFMLIFTVIIYIFIITHLV
jgi:hypothetical protein